MENKTSFMVDKDKLEVIIERVFDAPRELVWKTYTDPKLIPEWWGPRVFETTIEKMELKVGGEWRFVQKDPSGQTFAFYGVNKEIVPSEKLVSTFEFECTDGHVVLQTVTFEEVDGKTKVIAVAKYENIEDLEGMVSSGMEVGVVEGNDRLAELLQKMQDETTP
jgi:uncharacterized protein YndB with AHSA1/START domain